jgi:hypothetical protein
VTSSSKTLSALAVFVLLLLAHFKKLVSEKWSSRPILNFWCLGFVLAILLRFVMTHVNLSVVM